MVETVDSDVSLQRLWQSLSHSPLSLATYSEKGALDGIILYAGSDKAYRIASTVP